MATAADVPGKYDIVLNGQGYCFLDAVEPSLPFRSQRALYTRSPTFIPRQNVQGSFGDNQQDFWLTASQNDWSGGGEQRFYRQSDDQSRSEFWRSSAVDVSIPGQASLYPDIRSIDFGVGISALAACGNTGSITTMWGASQTNLYEVATDGTVTDRGAHGAGNINAFGLASDASNFRIFIAGQTKTRKYDTIAHTFADFSATPTSAVVYLNNTIYGMSSGYAQLLRFDTAGTATTLYTFQDSTGTATGTPTKLVPLGGKLALVRLAINGGELLIYDGTGVSTVAQFPNNFQAYSAAVLNGVLFIGGGVVTENNTKYDSAVYYYASGQIGKLWQSYKPSTNLSLASVAAWQGKLVIADETEGQFLFYEPSTGAMSSPGTFSSGTAGTWTAAGVSAFLHTRNTRFGYLFPHTSRPTSGTIQTSLFDFDSSVDKYVKAVKVDFDAATDGNGGSVDISYRLNDPDGSYTSVQTGAVAGTEYTIGQSCRSISIKVTLNKGTSTLGPVLKRIYVRAAPVLQQFRRREYILDLSGVNGVEPRILRDGTPHPKSGREQANDLETAASLTTPFSITDRFGTFTGLIDLNDDSGYNLYETHPGDDAPTKSGSFVARVHVREV